mgnify:CR=1 FL=1
MKIVFLDAETMGDVSFAPIEELGELVCYDRSTPEQACERVHDCDILIVNKVKVTPELIDAAASLKLICEAATGINNIDVEYASSKGIPVRNAVGYSTDSVVQMTFMQMLSLVGQSRYYDDAVKSGHYSSYGLFTDVSRRWNELSGMSIGIVGQVNYLLDFSDGRIHYTEVVDQHVSTGKSTSYYCTVLLENGEEFEIQVSRDLYRQIGVGSWVKITTYDGGLGMEYVAITG